MRLIRIQRADRFKLNFKEYLMRALKKDPTGSFHIIYNIYVIIEKQNKEHKFIPYFIIQSIIWKKKSLVISWKIRYSYFTG